MPLTGQVTTQHQCNFCFYLGLHQARGIDGLTINDPHVVEQGTEIGPIHAQLLLHRRRSQADLAPDNTTACRQAPGDVYLLNRVRERRLRLIGLAFETLAHGRTGLSSLLCVPQQVGNMDSLSHLHILTTPHRS